MKLSTAGKRIGICAVIASLCGGISVARAGVLDDIKGAISSLRGQKERKIGAVQGARSQANAKTDQVEFLRQRLLKTRNLLDSANDQFAASYRQMQSTERKIDDTKARAALIEAQYNQHKSQFGLRLASMQRHGQTNYLQVALGSMSLSDLSRRTAYFQALTRRDAAMEQSLKADKAEIAATQNTLMKQWKLRREAQQQATRERNRIVQGEAEQMQTWKQMSKARTALLSYAVEQARDLGSIDGKIGDLRARQSGIVADNQARAARNAAYEERQDRIAARERALDEYHDQMARERRQMEAQNTFRSRTRRRVVRDYSRQSEARAAARVAATSSRSSRSNNRYSRSRYRSTRYRGTRSSRRGASIRYNKPMPQFPTQLAPRVGVMPRYAPRIELAPMPIEALQNPAKFTLPPAPPR